jgi:hypothetical protein
MPRKFFGPDGQLHRKTYARRCRGCGRHRSHGGYCKRCKARAWRVESQR